MHRSIIVLILLALCIGLTTYPAAAQDVEKADVAAYQLGVVAEAKPGAEITYTITLTNYGPATVHSFYLLDGWSINQQGIGGFAEPIPDPNFGSFTVEGAWSQSRPDEEIFAWLLKGDLLPGATIRINWPNKVDPSYAGDLVNWAKIVTSEDLTGKWQPRSSSVSDPPKVTTPVDPTVDNNRTPDGLTVVTGSPTGQGIDMAIYQTGTLAQIKVGDPIKSTLLVTNLGPQSVNQFYLEAGASIGPDGQSIYVPPVSEPTFGKFIVLGRWRDLRKDEEVWLWLLQGTMPAGDSLTCEWSRTIIPTYRGDLVNWAAVSANGIPEGNWTPKGDTATTTPPLTSGPDRDPKNDRTADELTTVVE